MAAGLDDDDPLLSTMNQGGRLPNWQSDRLWQEVGLKDRWKDVKVIGNGQSNVALISPQKRTQFINYTITKNSFLISHQVILDF